jgi:geranylgeranyl diphosphate synthase type II
MADDLGSWLERERERLDTWLGPIFQDAWPDRFAEPLRYPLFGGGKRIRPALTIAAYGSLLGPDADPAPALAPAAAVELVHTYSLVHDDLPAMDDDQERRGRPTVHVQFDEGTAILVGDALLTHAFAILAKADLDAETRIRMVAELADASGYAGMIGGQVADIGATGRTPDPDYLTRLHEQKTGALLRCAALFGGLAAHGSDQQLALLQDFGEALGLAFQLQDDLLDAHEDEGANGPPSFVKLLGPETTRATALSCAQRARNCALKLPYPDRLVQMARYVVERTS